MIPRLLIVAALLIGGVVALSCTGGQGSGGRLCDPGENIFCRCPGGLSGTKRCNDDGAGFAACESIYGPCGSVTDGGIAVTAPAPKQPLYGPCGRARDCESDLCSNGACTWACTTDAECSVDGRCTTANMETYCRRLCRGNFDCEAYPGNTCGYVRTIDGATVAVCAAWEGPGNVAPVDTACDDHLTCNLGHVGAELVCSGGHCARGCYVKNDCATPQTCKSVDGGLGQCGAAD